MTDIAVSLDKVSKKYSRNMAAAMRYGLRDVVKDFLGRRIDPDHVRPHEFWSVKDASFQVKRGECLAVLGPNGAGKSTMLKLLNGIFLPDKGRIEMNGRIGALIELGAGFSPMLTGRENIYTNGGILGLSRAEIDERFDAIVDFADIGNFLDTAVKFYSSGMYVRLGFSIAAHVDPDILLVDEALAVGDQHFQEKCAARFDSFRSEGKTLVFVSHAMAHIEEICTRAIWLDDGRVRMDGAPKEVVAEYQAAAASGTTPVSV